MTTNQNEFREVPNILEYEVKDITLLGLTQVQDYYAGLIGEMPVREFLFMTLLGEINITINQLDNYHAQFTTKGDSISLTALQQAYDFTGAFAGVKE